MAPATPPTSTILAAIESALAVQGSHNTLDLSRCTEPAGIVAAIREWAKQSGAAYVQTVVGSGPFARFYDELTNDGALLTVVHPFSIEAACTGQHVPRLSMPALDAPLASAVRASIEESERDVRRSRRGAGNAYPSRYEDFSERQVWRP